MKSLFLTTVLLGLVAVLQAQEDQELQGTWYVKAIVANKSRAEDGNPVQMFHMKITVLEGGNLEAMGIFWHDGQCHEFKLVMKKTDQPGKYTFFQGKRTIYIEKVPVKDHIIAYCEDPRNGKSFGIGKLIGRDPEQNLEALEEFKKFAKRKKLLQENIVVPKRNVPAERCVSKLG